MEEGLIKLKERCSLIMKKISLLLFITILNISAVSTFAIESGQDAVETAKSASTIDSPDSFMGLYNKVLEYITENGITLSLNIFKALVIFLVGKFLARLIAKLVLRAMEKAKVDHTLARFVENIIYVALLAFIIIASIRALGVDTTSAIAVFGAAGLAVGLALQGSLSNFAAGVIMVMLRPIKLGDFVEIGGATGTVSKIDIFSTVVTGPDNVRTIVPNSHVTGSNIVNYTVNGTRRVDLVIGISYDDDIKKAKEILLESLNSNPLVLKDPAAFVGVLELADSSVNFAVRAWCKVENYWDVYFNSLENAKYALEADGITIPFPQHDVHMIGQSAS